MSSPTDRPGTTPDPAPDRTASFGWPQPRAADPAARAFDPTGRDRPVAPATGGTPFDLAGHGPAPRREGARRSPRRQGEVPAAPTPPRDGGAPPHGGRAPAGAGLLGSLRLTIGAKIGLLVGGLVLVLVASTLVLLNETRVTANQYNDVLAREGRQSQLVLMMQVAFRQQVQEWKDILLRGTNATDLATYTANFHVADAQVDQLYQQVLATDPDPALMAKLTRYHDLELATDTAYTRGLQIMEASHGQDFHQADQLVRGVDRAPTQALQDVVADRQALVSRLVTQTEAAARTRQQVALSTAVGLLILLVGLLAYAVSRLVRPVRMLTREAFRTATDRLPGAIAAIKAMEPGADPPRLPPFSVRSRDELHDLAEALTGLQDAALDQAVAQHRADRETSEMLVNLGRRNQNLRGRMLAYVTDLERREQDPEILSQLFQLDHAATRIRRNAESMLVLAGAHQTRTWSRPVPVIDVVRAALSEIEDYIRVDLHHVEDGTVTGTAVADVVHLVAELVENATHFSPPSTQVTVIGQGVREGYRLRVIDQGVGMTRRELDDANQRIRRADAGWSDAKLLGLYVVGRLARRRGIEVTLEASAGRGITASVLLPAALLGTRSDAPTGAVLPSAAALLDPQAATQDRGDRGPDRYLDLTDAGPGEPGSRTGDAGALVPATLPAQWAGDDDPAPAPYGRTGARSDVPMSPAGSTLAASRAGTWATSAPGAPAPVHPASNGHQPVLAPPGAVPRRVRGAQLPDLGPTEAPVVARPQEGPGAPDSLRWQLRSFQLDVQAARRAIAGSDPARPGPDEYSDPNQHRPDPNQHRPEGE